MKNQFHAKHPRNLMLFALILQAIIAPTYLDANPSPSTLLDKTINQALADRALAHGIQGVLIESLKDGRVLYERNADLVFIPASDLKLVISAAALDLLGSDHRIRTSCYISGKQTAEGVLKGDIILVGEGDPVFKHEHLKEMASRIKALGIKSVEGNVIGDDTLFDEVRLGWGWRWDNEPYYYSAQISALNLNENTVGVWVRPGKKVGEPASVNISPPSGYMVVRNECRTAEAGAKKDVLVDRVRGMNVIRVTGAVPLNYEPGASEEDITVEEPTLFTCQTLIEMLRRDGIGVKGEPVRGKKPDGARLVSVHDSPPMSEMIALLNKPSDNLIAECLLKALGASLKGEGSASAGVAVEMEFLKRIGADMRAVSIEDGSGLSRLNYISPRNLVTLLKHMYSHKHSRIYLNSLPIAGVDGDLKRRMRGTPAAGNAKAKPGYLSRVSTLSGFVTTKAGEPLVFSIMMNNHLCQTAEATSIQDRIVAGLADLR